jgi:hypothetical protein
MNELHPAVVVGHNIETERRCCDDVLGRAHPAFERGLVDAQEVECDMLALRIFPKHVEELQARLRRRKQCLRTKYRNVVRAAESRHDQGCEEQHDEKIFHTVAITSRDNASFGSKVVRVI